LVAKFEVSGLSYLLSSAETGHFQHGFQHERFLPPLRRLESANAGKERERELERAEVKVRGAVAAMHGE
jgi:hypothetical protein